MKTKGLLVALEGIDNAGKTSLIARLAEYFQRSGIPVTTTKELTSPIGAFIWEGLYAKNLTPFLKTYLFATDRAIRAGQRSEYPVRFLCRQGAVFRRGRRSAGGIGRHGDARPAVADFV